MAESRLPSVDYVDYIPACDERYEDGDRSDSYRLEESRSHYLHYEKRRMGLRYMVWRLGRRRLVVLLTFVLFVTCVGTYRSKSRLYTRSERVSMELSLEESEGETEVQQEIVELPSYPQGVLGAPTESFWGKYHFLMPFGTLLTVVNSRQPSR